MKFRAPAFNQMTIFNPDDRYLRWRPEGPRRHLPQLELREVKSESKVMGVFQPRPATLDGSDKLAAINGRARIKAVPTSAPSKRRTAVPRPVMLVNVRFAPALPLNLQIQHPTYENNPE